MSPEMILALINGLILMAFNMWSTARKVFGKEAIPEWPELMNKNMKLQMKIEAELGSQ